MLKKIRKHLLDLPPHPATALILFWLKSSWVLPWPVTHLSTKFCVNPSTTFYVIYFSNKPMYKCTGVKTQPVFTSSALSVIFPLLSISHINMKSVLGCQGSGGGGLASPVLWTEKTFLLPLFSQSWPVVVSFTLTLLSAPTGALKSYLRELPEPLMTTELYDEWIQASKWVAVCY